MAEIILNTQFSLDNSETSDRLLKRGNWENYCFTRSLVSHVLWGWIEVWEKSATSLPQHAPEFKKRIGCLQFLYRNSYDLSCGWSMWSNCLPLPPFSTPRLIVLKISAVRAAKASAFRMTALSLKHRTPIIVNEMRSLLLSIYVVWPVRESFLTLGETKSLHRSCCSFLWWRRKIILFKRFARGKVTKLFFSEKKTDYFSSHHLCNLQ